LPTAFKRAEDECIGHAIDITSRFGVSESLVGCGLLKAVRVGNLSSTVRGGSSAEKSEDGILDVIWVVQKELGVDSVDDVPVRMLLGNFALLQHRSRASRGSANEGKGEDCVLHLEYRSFAECYKKGC
jgi:hypothetical protein